MASYVPKPPKTGLAPSKQFAYVAMPPMGGSVQPGKVILVDNTPIDRVYYRTDAGPVPQAYCWKESGQPVVSAVFQRHAEEMRELQAQQYRELMALRKEWGL